MIKRAARPVIYSSELEVVGEVGVDRLASSVGGTTKERVVVGKSCGGVREVIVSSPSRETCMV